MTTSADTPLESRTVPVQPRGHARVDALLDAAAVVIEEVGIAGLTTSVVAERSGSSVGVVYRYFPNADAMLIALAERNLAQFREVVAETLEQRPPADWREYAKMCIDVFADFSRTVPAFRVVRFGDVVSIRFAHRDSSNNERIGELLIDILVERYGFKRTDELEFATQLAMECADAVSRRSFLHDPSGEPRFLQAAKDIVLDIIGPHSPDR